MAHREAEWSSLVADEKDDLAEQTLCAFCTHTTADPHSAFVHMKEAHGFDLHASKAARRWSFYDCIRVINYCRASAAAANSTAAGTVLSKDQIAALIGAEGAWKNEEKYLAPYLPDDPLLFSIQSGGGGDSDDDWGDDDDGDDKPKKQKPAAAAPAAAAKATAAAPAATAAAGGDAKEREIAALKAEVSALRNRVNVLTAVAVGTGAGGDALDASDTRAGAKPRPVDDSDDEPNADGDASGDDSEDDKKPADAKSAPAAVAAADVKGLAPTATAASAAPAANKPYEISAIEKRRRQRIADNDSDYFGAYSDLYIHEIMLRDKVRTEAYRDFMYKNKDLFKDKVVLDIGCGSGILSLFAVKAGARKVIGIDNAAIIEKAREIVAKNGVRPDVLHLVRGKVEEIDHLPGGVTEVDIIISEWMGYFLLFESMLPTVLYARDKWLKKSPPAAGAGAGAAPGAAVKRPAGVGVYPNAATMYIAGMETNEFKKNKIDWWSDVYGFDFTPLLSPADKLSLQLHGGGGEGGAGTAGGMAASGQTRDGAALGSVEIVKGTQIMTTTAPLIRFDMMTVHEKELEFESKFSITIQRNCPLTAFVVHFDTDFNFGISDPKNAINLNTAANTTPTHWQQTVFYLSTPIVVPGSDAKSNALPAGEWKVEGVLEARRCHSRNDREYSVTIRYALVHYPVGGGSSAAAAAAKPVLTVQDFLIK